MKILWISHVVPYPPKGGLWQRSYNLLKQISKNNDVHLVTLNQHKLLPTPDMFVKAKESLLRLCSKVDIFPIISDRKLVSWCLMTARSYFDDRHV